MTKKLSLKQIPDFYFFLILFVINFVFISLAIHYYPEKFLPIYPYSYASMVLTYQNHLPNNLSSHIYAIGMFLSAITMFAFAYHRRLEKDQKGFGRVLIQDVCGIGFLIATFSPDDSRHTFHVIGSALIVATIWMMATNYLASSRRRVSSTKYYFLQAILQIPIVTYALTYFLDLDIQSILQKFAILSLAVILFYSTFRYNYDE